MSSSLDFLVEAIGSIAPIAFASTLIIAATTKLIAEKYIRKRSEKENVIKTPHQQ